MQLSVCYACKPDSAWLLWVSAFMRPLEGRVQLGQACMADVQVRYGSAWTLADFTRLSGSMPDCDLVLAAMQTIWQALGVFEVC